MEIEELRRNMRKVAALLEIYDDTKGKENIDLERKKTELKIAREQIIKTLIDAKKVLLGMERETKNV